MEDEEYIDGFTAGMDKCQAEIVALKSLVQHYQTLALADGCPYDKGECDAKAALKALMREMGEVLQPLCGGFWPGQDPLKAIDKGTEILNRPEVKAIMEEE